MNSTQMGPLSPAHVQSIDIPPDENPGFAPMVQVHQVSNAPISAFVAQGAQQIRILGERAAALIKDWYATAKPYLKLAFPDKSTASWGGLSLYCLCCGGYFLSFLLGIAYLASLLKAKRLGAASQTLNQIQNNLAPKKLSICTTACFDV